MSRNERIHDVLAYNLAQAGGAPAPRARASFLGPPGFAALSSEAGLGQSVTAQGGTG